MIRLRWAVLILGLFGLGLLWPAVASAQKGRVTLELDRHIASVGEEIQVTVSIEAEGRAGYDRYLKPTFRGFRLMGSGMTTQNIEMINWKVRRRESHQYVIVPLREGTLQVGPAAIVIGGNTIQSKKVSLRVNRAAGRSAQPAEADPDPDSDPQDDTLTARQAEQSVFINAVAVPAKVYQGQQVVVVWSLYTQSNILGFQLTRQPAADDFWSEDLRSPQRLEFERKIVDNRMFYVATLARKALFPQKSGQLVVGAMAAQLRTMQQFSSTAVTRQSDPLTIEVQPLPSEGRPADFSPGNVGQFEIWSVIDQPKIKAGDAVTLKVVIRGKGNLSQLKLPPLGEVDGFKIYEPKISDRLALEDGVGGEKILEYLLLPVRSGRLKIPPFRLSFFDPRVASYREVRSRPLTLTVTGKLPTTGGQGADAKKNVLAVNIRPPRPAAPLSHRVEVSPHRSSTFWLLVAAPLLMLIFVSGGERVRAHLVKETPRSLRRAAARQTNAHFRRAQERRQKRDAPGFFGEIAAALQCQLDRQMRIKTEGLTREELQSRMLASGFAADLVQDTVAELDNCDFARFAPSASGAEQMEQTLKRTRQLINQLGRTLTRCGGAS